MAIFPEEILDQICWELCLRTTRAAGRSWLRHQQTLRSLMCSSRSLHRLSRPVFYDTLIVGGAQYSMPLHHLLQVCIAKPETAHLIKKLDFKLLEYREKPKPAATLSDYDRMTGTLRSVNISNSLRAAFAEKLLRGDVDNDDLAVALILILCENLNVLEMHTSKWNQSLTLRLADEVAAQSCRGPLAHLSAFRTWYWHPSISQPILDFHSFLRLPSMETFTGVKMSMAEWDPSFPYNAQYSLRYVDLIDSTVDAKGMERLLTVCPNLIQIKLQIGLKGIGRVVNFGDYGECLRRCGTRLECFKLHTCDNNEYYHHRGKLGDLTSLNRLKLLQVEWEALNAIAKPPVKFNGKQLKLEYLSETLPASLEQFEIRTTPYNEHYVQFFDLQILEMMTSDRLPNLNMITTKRHRFFTLKLPPDWQDFSTENLKPRVARPQYFLDIGLERRTVNMCLKRMPQT